MIVLKNKKDCCGCTACLERCPKHCVIMQEDSEGFLYPQVDESKCVDCHLCESVCPILTAKPQEYVNGEIVLKDVKTFAAKNNNEAERMDSSSGGVFILLAKRTLAQNGVVFGAVYDENWEVKISYAETLDDIKKMMGSKYLQARVENAYKEAECFLKQGREVLFTGTSCQIAGLKSFLRKDYPNLLTADCLCHGVPSPGVWRKYLHELKSQAACKAAAGKNFVLSLSLNEVPAIAGISFRDKNNLGWKKFCFDAQASAGTADKNIVLTHEPHYENSYMRGFLANVYLRPSCYECRFKNGASNSDLTLADFWGVNNLMPDFDDDKGVGFLACHSQKAIDVVSQLDLDVRECSLKDAVRFNSSYYKSVAPHAKRDEFFEKFSKGERVSAINSFILHVPLSRRMLRKVKSLIKRILKKMGLISR